MLRAIEKQERREDGEERLLLDEIARQGAQRMLMTALKWEADSYVDRHRGERDEQGHALVVRNGRASTRKVTLGSGTVELQAPRVDDRRRDEQGRRQRFTSHILKPYAALAQGRRGAADTLPARTGDRHFRPALEALLGAEAAGLSPTNITRLTAGWAKEYQAFRQRDLSGREYVYVWVDGVHFNIRLEEIGSAPW
jgi:transposase-like protein